MDEFVGLLPAIALCLALSGTLLTVRDWYVARRRMIAECPHRWVYASAWHEGRFWHRLCRDCPKQEVVALEDVPEWWRRQERAAQASSREDVGRPASVTRRRSHPAHAAERRVNTHKRTRPPKPRS
jgi:hypothetical protein